MHVRCFLCNLFSEFSPHPGQDRESRFLCEHCRTWNRLRRVERGDRGPEYVVVGIDVEPPKKS